jgi:hypothetical protein
MGDLTTEALALSLAVAAVFVAHEPALILAGHRGGKRLRRDGTAARRWLALLCVVALGALGPVLAGASAILWLSLTVPTIGGLLTLGIIALGRERSTWGELVIAGTLAGAGLPVAIAAGVDPGTAASTAAAWMVAFSVSTLSVRAVLERFPGRWACALGIIALLGTLGFTASTGLLWPLGLAPLLLATVWISLRPPPRTRLRRVGLTLAGLHGLVLLSLALFPPA